MSGFAQGTCRWTEEEISAVLSCLANRVRLCCGADGRSAREACTRDPIKRYVLATFAHESLGCTPSIEWWEEYFDRAVAWFSPLAGHR